MANPQLENGYIRIANEILDEIILRNFSKRQRNIIDFILRLSYGCNKKYAVIPRYTKSFELCGVSNQNITKELNDLVIKKVIFWEKETNVFQVNKDFDEWGVSCEKEINITEFKKLISLNLTNSQNESKTLNLREELSKQGEVTLKTRVERLSKQELNEADNIDCEQEKNPPKDTIKNNIYILSEKTKNIPYEEIKNLYSETCINLSKITVLTDKRKKLIKKAWKNFPDIEDWKVIFAHANTVKWNLEPPNDKPNFDQIFEKERYAIYFEASKQPAQYVNETDLFNAKLARGEI